MTYVRSVGTPYNDWPRTKQEDTFARLDQRKMLPMRLSVRGRDDCPAAVGNLRAALITYCLDELEMWPFVYARIAGNCTKTTG